MDAKEVFHPTNDFPTPLNQPKPSFPVPVVAPDVDPDDAESSIAVQYSAAWVPVVMAAIDQLPQYASWQGDADDKKLAADRADTLKYLLQEPVTVTGDIPTPYWDDVTDTDDEATPALQTWYGEVTNPTDPPDELDFVENAAIWAFTGMLAVGAGAGAALLFHTVAPRFVVAMRGNSFVEVLRVILDGEEQARVTTSGDPDELIEIPIVGDDSAHDLLIVRES